MAIVVGTDTVGMHWCGPWPVPSVPRRTAGRDVVQHPCSLAAGFLLVPQRTGLVLRLYSQRRLVDPAPTPASSAEYPTPARRDGYRASWWKSLLGLIRRTRCRLQGIGDKALGCPLPKQWQTYMVQAGRLAHNKVPTTTATTTTTTTSSISKITTPEHC
jgi:hypothetical protein